MSVLDDNNFAEMKCRDYGFECEYQTNGNMKKVLNEFRDHSIEIHGINYEIGVLGHIIRRKYPETRKNNN